MEIHHQLFTFPCINLEVVQLVPVHKVLNRNTRRTTLIILLFCFPVFLTSASNPVVSDHILLSLKMVLLGMLQISKVSIYPIGNLAGIN